MKQSIAPKMKYHSATGGRLSLELDQASVLALATIVHELQQASSNPLALVSRSTATRRALQVYAASLSLNSIKDGVLKAEARRATAGTYSYRDGF